MTTTRRIDPASRSLGPNPVASDLKGMMTMMVDLAAREVGPWLVGR